MHIRKGKGGHCEFWENGGRLTHTHTHTHTRKFRGRKWIVSLTNSVLGTTLAFISFNHSNVTVETWDKTEPELCWRDDGCSSAGIEMSLAAISSLEMGGGQTGKIINRWVCGGHCSEEKQVIWRKHKFPNLERELMNRDRYMLLDKRQ